MELRYGAPASGMDVPRATNKLQLGSAVPTVPFARRGPESERTDTRHESF